MQSRTHPGRLRCTALLALSLLPIAPCCDKAGAPDTPLTRPPVPLIESRFSLAVLLPEDSPPPATNATAGTTAGCAVPVRGTALPAQRPAEVDLLARITLGGQHVAEVRTDGRGVAALAALQMGGHQISLRTGDRLLGAFLSADLQVRRTQIQGGRVQDRQDIDRDGDRAEWLLWAEVLPDADQDGVSDTGEVASWWFSPDGAVGWVHPPGVWSASFVLDYSSAVVGYEEYPDRDGDFLADPIDADADGDGIEDAAEGDTLSCPGIEHDALYVAGTAHADFTCAQCHRDGDPMTLQCHDCHTAQGRGFCGEPATLPSNHPMRGCEHCHRPDESWQDFPGSSSTERRHDDFPLTGQHLQQDCFVCHPTGNLSPTPNRCADCHPLPQDHLPASQLACDLCHSTDGWLPVVAHQGALPDTVFDYGSWSDVWFPPQHGGIVHCDSCHVRMHTHHDFSYFSCTDNCHGQLGRLRAWHNWGNDTGSDPSTQFHLYFYDPDDTQVPTDWPTGHTGCVNAACHDNGSKP